MLARTGSYQDQVVAAMPKLRAFAISLCRSQDRADDLVQDTIVAALAHQDKFRPGTNLEAWLFVILRNHHYTQFRKRKREVEDPDETMAKAIPVFDSPLRKLEVAEALALIDQMPPKWRLPLKMAADGATLEEIAAELTEQVGTIKSRIHRGRSLLEDSE